MTFSFYTRTWLLLTVIPTLGIITIVVGVFLSFRLYDIILMSIERKLIASSTSTATLIKGEEHDWLVRRYRPSAMVYHPGEDRLYALDAEQQLLLILNPGTGRIEGYQTNLPVGLQGLTLAPDGEDLLTLRGNPSEIHRLDPATGALTPHHALGVKASSLYWDEARHALLLTLPQPGGETTLFEMAWPDGPLQDTGLFFLEEPRDISRAGPWPAPLLGLAPDRHHLIFPQSIGELTESLSLHIIDEETQEEWEDYPIDALWPSALAFDHLRERLLGTGLVLLQIDRENGTVDPRDFAPVFGKEGHPLHLFFNYGLKRVIEELGLTYIYSLAHIEGTDFLYGVDGTIDHPDYSALLTVDAFPETELKGVERVIDRQDFHVSGIIEWELWGLVKTAYAPIRNTDGKTVGVMGADVAIDIIKDKTRAALAGVVLTGLTALLIGILSAFQIGRQIVLPLERIKNSALRIAAGARDETIRIRRPRELNQLAEAFNQINQDFQTKADTLRGSARQDREQRDHIELARHLGSLHETGNFSPREAFRYRSAKAYAYEVSGACKIHSLTIVWLGPSGMEALEATALRSRIETLLPILAPLHKGHAESFVIQLQKLFREAVTAWFILDEEGSLHFASAPGVAVCQLHKTGHWQSLTLPEKGLLPLRTPLLLSAPNPAADALPSLDPASPETAQQQLNTLIKQLPPASGEIFFGLLLPSPFQP